MFCGNCGNKLIEGSKFCNQCGKPVYSGCKQSEGKCPKCGGNIESFMLVCPYCGYEIRERESNLSIQELERRLREIENERVAKDTKGLIISAYSTAPDPIDEKISVQIMTFPIPNTKEDIFEFMILAASNIDPTAYDKTSKFMSQYLGKKAIADAWSAKFNQAYQKALLLFPDDSRLKDVYKLYDDKERQIGKEKKKLTIIVLLILIGGFLFFALLFGFVEHMAKMENGNGTLWLFDLQMGQYFWTFLGC